METPQPQSKDASTVEASGSPLKDTPNTAVSTTALSSPKRESEARTTMVRPPPLVISVTFEMVLQYQANSARVKTRGLLF